MAELAQRCAAKRQQQASAQDRLRAAVREAVEALGGQPDLQGGWTVTCSECGETRTITALAQCFIRDSSVSGCEAMMEVTRLFNDLRREHLP
jgi:hypothetical protein